MRPTHAPPDPMLGATLRRLRLERGTAQEALAFDAGLTTGSLSRIERNASNPAWTTVHAILGALGITLQELAAALENGAKDAQESEENQLVGNRAGVGLITP